MFFICWIQPPSFMRNASKQRSLGILSKPDSVSSRSVPVRFSPPEFDERGHLLRVIYFGIDSIRMPGEGKESFGLHFCTTASHLRCS